MHGYYGTSGKEKIIKSLVIWMWILRIPLNWQKRTISLHGYYCTCPMARDTWRRASIDLPPAGFSQNSVFLNLYHLLKQVQKSPKDMNIQAFPWILWHLWKSRNGLAFERKHYSSVSVLTKAKEEAHVWFEINASGSDEVQTSLVVPRDPAAWIKPPPSHLKCNI